MRQPLTERYRERLAGVLSCYDRIIVTGTLPGACYAKGMTGLALSSLRFGHQEGLHPRQRLSASPEFNPARFRAAVV